MSQDLGDAVDHYRLTVDRSGDSAFEPIPSLDRLEGTEVELSIVLLNTDWPSVRYQVAAFDSAGARIGDSGPVSLLEQTSSAELVTFIKATNTDADDFFGGALALSADGRTLAVGAQNEDSGAATINGDQEDDEAENAGAVYVFRELNGAWTPDAYIKASNAETFDSFGIAVALSADGSRLAVGAMFEDSAARGIDQSQGDNESGNSGATYVFDRSEAGWAQTAYLKQGNTNGDRARFGLTVSLSADGGVLAVGASEESSSSTGVNADSENSDAVRSGAVYVFRDGDNGWIQEAYIKASNTGIGDEFGRELSLSGDGNTLAVAAFLEQSSATGVGGNQSNNDLEGAGAVYVFRRMDLTWLQEAYIKASNTDAQDLFGISLAMSSEGSKLVVGAQNEDGGDFRIDGNQSDNSAQASGAAYVFARTEGQWIREAYLKPADGQFADLFAASVSMSSDGDTIAVGALGDNGGSPARDASASDGTVEDSGAAYLFRREGSSWIQRAYLNATLPATGDSFASQVALSGDASRLVVGAPREDSGAAGVSGDQTDNSAEGSGAVYVY
ncbi:MAG: integrin [Myxococcota bacterium]